MYLRCICGIIIIITVIITATLRLTINIIVTKKVRRVSDGGFGWVWEGKQGMTMVAEPQLTNTNSFEELHVEACGEVNLARSAQDG